MKVALVTHSGPGDTFWDIVRKGAEAAAAKDNIELTYSADPDGAAAGQPGADRDRPEGRRHRGHPGQAGRGRSPNVKKAVAAGIPVSVAQRAVSTPGRPPARSGTSARTRGSPARRSARS